jgi:hypothetical protein
MSGVNRANSSNSLGIGVTQGPASPQAVAAIATISPGTYITPFPRPAGQTITVVRLNGAMSAAGCLVGDIVERDSDGGFWDITVSGGFVVPCDFTSYQPGNDMLSN